MLAQHINRVDASVLFSDALAGRQIPEITRILNRFPSLTLREMESMTLLKRVDTKFIFHLACLPEVLHNLTRDYAVLSVDGVRLQPYTTQYFDTPDFQLYHQHHNGQRERFKLRIRTYRQTGLDVLEIKSKDNHDRTRKHRLPIAGLLQDNPVQVRAFLEKNLPLHQNWLAANITNGFFRIALASLARQERLTLDLGIRFVSAPSRFSLPGVVVAEVKQPKFSLESVFIESMRAMGCRPTRFSKYCIGAALAYPQLKRNTFKPLLRTLQNLILQGGPL